jgi:hypothetical protein
MGPVGTNGGDDRLILIPSNDPAVQQDAVFWWDHETGEVHKVTSDFKELR